MISLLELVGAMVLLELKIPQTQIRQSFTRMPLKRSTGNNSRKTRSTNEELAVSISPRLTATKEIALGAGTSKLLDVGSDTYKRPSSLHGGGKPETIVELSYNWKSKDPVKTSPFKSQSSHERIFVPASNVERAKEDGCMNKLKIERTYKLW